MKRDLTVKLNSSFLSFEKDCEIILRKLFIESKPYNEDLVRLLVINTPDCLDNKDNEVYKEVLEKTNLQVLKNEGYIKLVPKVGLAEHEEIKSYIIISFDNFTTNASNPEFRDCTVHFDVICHTDYWDIGDYRLRPLKICGIIDGILNNKKLTGIGTFQFLGCNELILSNELAGYSLMYQAVHGSDDKIPSGN
jgi:hypothetical protein